MKRLTKKVSVGYNPAPQKYGSRAIYNKLGQLEDIEEEFGIDLITLFKSLKFNKNRLTNIKGISPRSIFNADNLMTAIYNKCWKIENYETILGVDFEIIVKALKNGFYSKSKEGIKFWKEDENHIVFVRHLGYDIEICCEECKNERNAIPTMFLERSTEDYGKTWALTKEELEK